MVSNFSQPAAESSRVMSLSSLPVWTGGVELRGKLTPPLHAEVVQSTYFTVFKNNGRQLQPGSFLSVMWLFLISYIGTIFRNVSYYYSGGQYIYICSVFSHVLYTQDISDSFILLSLIDSQLLSVSPFLNPSLLSSSPPLLPSPPLPPHHQSEGTGSIVIGLQS